MNVQPIDVVALVQVFFTGVAAVLGGLAAVFGVIAAARAKRAETATIAVKEKVAEVTENVALIKSHTNSMTTEIARLSKQEGLAEGERKGLLTGQDAARLLAEGQRQGIETERAAVAASDQGEQKLQSEQKPVPVADARTAIATERIADATEKKTKRGPGPS